MSRAACLLAALLCAAPARGQGSDAELMQRGPSATFKRPLVVLLPLVDLRPLSTAPEALSQPLEASKLWASFVDTLSARGNLEVVPPDRVEAFLRTRGRGYDGMRQAAEVIAKTGRAHYQEARLEEAIQSLGRAAEMYQQVLHHHLSPPEVAQMHLIRGQAHLENGNPTQAREAFGRALRADPTLRLQPGQDRPRAVELFEQARADLLAESSLAPLRTEHPEVMPEEAVIIYSRLFKRRLDLRIATPIGVSEYAITLPKATGAPAQDDAAAREAGDLLAARVWSCLPFGSAPPTPEFPQRLYLDAGLGAFALLNAPGDGLFRHVGLSASASWLIAPNFTLDGGFQLTNSNRDRSADLRSDLVMLRTTLGPGYSGRRGRWRLGARAAFELARHGAITTTANPDCKYFADAEEAPPNGCTPRLDIDHVDSGWMVGLNVAGSVAFTLVGEIYVAVRVEAGDYFFHTEDHDLGLPVGAQVGLGYGL